MLQRISGCPVFGVKQMHEHQAPGPQLPRHPGVMTNASHGDYFIITCVGAVFSGSMSRG